MIKNKYLQLNSLNRFKRKTKNNNYKILFPIILFLLLSISISFNIVYLINNSNNKKIIKKLRYNLFNYHKNVEIAIPSNSTNISKIQLLKIITNNNEYDYKGAQSCLINGSDTQLCIYHLLAPKKVVGKNRALYGRKADGAYVLLDDLENVKIAYSFGIERNVIFDEQLALNGIDVYMYDHTIYSLPKENQKFHWKKIGLCGTKSNNKNLKTLEELIIENNHTNEENMILKIDIENAEWDSLDSLQEKYLYQFKYIVIEFHFVKPFYEEKYYNVLKKLHKSHQVFFIRCNGRDNIIAFGNNKICQFLEVSYVIRKGNKFTKDDFIYPIYHFDFVPAKLLGMKEFNLNILKLFDDEE